MEGRINTTFGTYQADLFESGLVAQIGTNSFAIWSAIKAHSDFQTGVSYPSIRRLMELTGLASATVQKCLGILEQSHLLRSEVKGKRRYYIARERLDVSIGNRILCTVVLDYVPSSMRENVKKIKDAFSGAGDNEILAQVDIIPGAGFIWDESRKVLTARVQASEIPSPVSQPGHLGQLGERIAKQARLLKN